MLFRNAQIFRLTSAVPESDALAEALAANAFTPCSGLRPSSFGWVTPVSITDGPLCHEVAGCVLLCARREDKVIPSSALNEVLQEKVERLEQMEGRKLRSKEKMRLKDDAMAELLPRALARSKQILGYISLKDEMLIIDSASTAEAELFINCLRDSLGTFAVVPPQVKSKPTDLYTHWLNTQKLPVDFGFGDACDLVDIEDGASVTCRKQDIASREIRTHLEAGKICTRIGLRWHSDLRLTVDKDLILRQIKVESSDDDMDEEENPFARLDAAFVNMTLEFSRFLPALFAALGGEHRE